ncbi:MAG TPA: methyltransferase domain-containing protein [Candidatus Dormibacteraeota bacterium]|nr:methyltransferase domain-containing protein [Candidatus Dormibacteraeota bacterium]
MEIERYLDMLQVLDRESIPYLSDLRALPEPAGHPPHDLKSALIGALPASLRMNLRVAFTMALRPLSNSRAATMTRSTADPGLHLGCGPVHLDGWINVDLYGKAADVALDLRHPTPFEDSSMAAVFHEHLLEHLALPDGTRLLRECYRLLRPGGVIRVAVPDFGAYAESYAGNGEFLGRARPGRPTKLMALSEVVYAHGHRSLWDAETLCALLSEIGFRDAERREFGESRIEPCPDSPERKIESLYVEALKPG